MRKAYVPLAKRELASKEVDLQELFNDYWTSKAHELSVRGQSASQTSPLITDREAQGTLSLGSIVSSWSWISLQKLMFVSLQPPIMTITTI
jgi:hypothetical protein